MATTISSFGTTRIISSASSNHRKPDPSRRRGPPSAPASSNWWTPLFGWPSDPDYINDPTTMTEPIQKKSEQTESESGRAARSRFSLGCFTKEKARELRRKTLETETFHDVMYHSAIASRLATNVNDGDDR